MVCVHDDHRQYKRLYEIKFKIKRLDHLPARAGCMVCGTQTHTVISQSVSRQMPLCLSVCLCVCARMRIHYITVAAQKRKMHSKKKRNETIQNDNEQNCRMNATLATAAATAQRSRFSVSYIN